MCWECTGRCRICRETVVKGIVPCDNPVKKSGGCWSTSFPPIHKSPAHIECIEKNEAQTRQGTSSKPVPSKRDAPKQGAPHSQQGASPSQHDASKPKPAVSEPERSKPENSKPKSSKPESSKPKAPPKRQITINDNEGGSSKKPHHGN